MLFTISLLLIFVVFSIFEGHFAHRACKVLGMIIFAKGRNDGTRGNLFVAFTAGMAKKGDIVIGAIEFSILMMELVAMKGGGALKTIKVVFMEFIGTYTDELGSGNELIAGVANVAT